jgi:myosin heavy subunit
MQAMKPHKGGRGMKRFFAVLLTAAGVEPSTYQLGSSKVFFRAGKGEPVERLLVGDAEAKASLKQVEARAAEEWIRVARNLVGTSVLTFFLHRKFKAYFAARMKNALRLQRHIRSLWARRKWLVTLESAVKRHKEVQRKKLARHRLKKAMAGVFQGARATKELTRLADMKRGGKVRKSDFFRTQSRRVSNRRQASRLSREATRHGRDLVRASKMSRLDSSASLAKADFRRGSLGGSFTLPEEEDKASFGTFEKHVWAPTRMESEFEMELERDDKTGSLGILLDEFYGDATIVLVENVGAAKSEGTLQVGDALITWQSHGNHIAITQQSRSNHRERCRSATR